MKPILLTGFRPTGDLHLGHYFSLIDPIIQNQNDFKIFVLVADLHALTELRKSARIDFSQFKSEIDHNTESAIIAISHFVNIDNLVIFRQSDLMRFHYDLFYKLLMLSRHNLTFGNPIFIDAMRSELSKDIDSLKLDSTYKDLLNEFVVDHQEILWGNISSDLENQLFLFIRDRYIALSKSQVTKIVKLLNTRVGVMGLATYPILMAADIILYRPQYVLVGSDQEPHIQITNDLIKIMNNTFGTTIDKVHPMIYNTMTLKGNDGRKMSKTFNNHIPLMDLANGFGLNWFKSLRTYPRLKNQCGNPNECLVGEYSKVFKVNNYCIQRCSEGSVGCVECKTSLYNDIDLLMNYKSPYDKEIDINQILNNGSNIAIDRIVDNKIFDLIR